MGQFPRFALISILTFAFAPAFGGEPQPLSPELQLLDRGVGKWIYHGRELQTAYSKAGKWTWEEDCGWSANRIYLVCSFDMRWPEGPDHSVSLTTYNMLDKAYWHYEIIDDNKGDKPVVSRMSIVGDEWTEISGGAEVNGKTAPHFKVTYRYASPTRVTVKFEMSKDGTHWTTLGDGEGMRRS